MATTVRYFTVTNDRGQTQGFYCTMRDTKENPDMHRCDGLQTFRFVGEDHEYDVLDWLARMDGDF